MAAKPPDKMSHSTEHHRTRTLTLGVACGLLVLLLTALSFADREHQQALRLGGALAGIVGVCARYWPSEEPANRDEP